jgi:hypothetical protein
MRPARPPRSPMRNSRPRRDWSEAEIKRRGVCLVCGIDEHEARQRGRRLELAHTISREHDQPHPTRPNTLRVDPDDVVTLCGPATSTDTCHARQQNRQLDIGPYLTVDEWIAAIRAAGSAESARKRLLPSDYAPEIDAARVAAIQRQAA